MENYLTMKEVMEKVNKSTTFIKKVIKDYDFKGVTVSTNSRGSRIYLYHPDLIDLIKQVIYKKETSRIDYGYIRKKDTSFNKEVVEEYGVKWKEYYKIAESMRLSFKDIPIWELEFFVKDVLKTTMSAFYSIAPIAIKRRMEKLNLIKP